MGYNTSYGMEVEPEPDFEAVDKMIELKAAWEKSGLSEMPPEINEVLSKPQNAFLLAIRAHDDASYALDNDLSASDSCKWYEHEKDVRELSAQFPTLFITLRGDGEEQGDQWIEYYKAGKMQRVEAKITFAPFDPKKLA